MSIFKIYSSGINMRFDLLSVGGLGKYSFFAGTNASPVNILELSSINISVGGNITLQTTSPSNTPGLLGSYAVVYTIAGVTITSGSYKSLSSAAFTIPVGIYIITFNANFTLSAAAGSITSFSMGLGTVQLANNMDKTGDVFITGTHSLPGTFGYLLGSATTVINVPAGGQSLWILCYSTHSGPTITSTANSFIRYQRIA